MPELSVTYEAKIYNLCPFPAVTVCLHQRIRQIKGVITDSLTNEPLMYITVQYEGKGVGGISNANGEYQVETHKGWDELTFSAVGYITKKVKLNPGTGC